jgi:two-component system chemotaxis response regulator CheY
LRIGAFDMLERTMAAVPRPTGRERSDVVVLVIDDDAEIRQALTEILEDEEYTVRCASNGREALEILSRGPCPDVILLDVMMPVMDGWHFLSARLGVPELVEVPIIIISAGFDAEREAHKVGVFEFARKPLHVDDLVERIESCRRRARSSPREVSPSPPPL